MLSSVAMPDIVRYAVVVLVCMYASPLVYPDAVIPISNQSDKRGDDEMIKFETPPAGVLCIRCDPVPDDNKPERIKSTPIGKAKMRERETKKNADCARA
ncbi:hypothetical protein K458DRAFT_36275 [Lentithecium fluviatile CBS 122367]|uniref:Uncharacterized protein n=1 Tax=Lentithecium fluviatile CBS 122367 TaxID=1168545 RepID=A0A6G1J0G1_9PLEO|nr:hypothetical protein K458DRAFT_36275 [Lentithecium fluviatile CBS 122367]